MGNRLVQHNQNKDFWNRALVVISLTNSMTQTHALFLEWFAIQQATQAGRYSLENGNTGARPHTPAPLATLGQPIFEALTGTPERVDGKSEAPELFYCRGPEVNGVGEYNAEGFVVHKGSTARIEIVASIKGTSQEHFRQQLVTEGLLALDGDHYVFTRDHLFASPSMAAIAILGRSANGWLEWKTAQGQTLDGAKRQLVKVVG
ncbi:GIY-YIG nuclease family protein [Rhodoferax ferrireducens]|uniref:GIY-YIG nuclease family protein n=1 Tax=Rhodoferax ferrireducens TaxID=192843 RepID=UPI00298DEC77|nr:GIY-YIG nuclease family protein [Rhodoferax ferrireducens]WPC68678.1 GIY-YIG nuclease family protein [Rhodoferax ferrireducens]